MSNNITTQSGFFDLLEDLFDFRYDPEPQTISFIAFCGFFISTIFLYIYKDIIQANYGKHVFWWFFALLLINLINVSGSSLYYVHKTGKFIGMRGISGEKGKAGESGDLRVCGFCKNKDEIGVVYSTQSYNLGKLGNSSSLTGELTFWRPYGQSGLRPIGDTVFQGSEGSQTQNYLVGVGGKDPINYKKIVYIQEYDLTFWRPEPPKGYLSLGDLVIKGKNKPDKYHSVCINEKCMSETDSKQIRYVATYPEFTEINEDGNEIKFLSVWMTNLNTFYISYSDEDYSNNTLWYNLTRGSSEYYDKKDKKANQDKIDEFVEFLKTKVSIIPRDTNENIGISVNSSFIENQTDSNGKIILYVFNGILYEKDVNKLNEFEFWKYFMEIVKIILLLYNRVGERGIEFKYIDSIEDLSIRQTGYLLDNLFPSRDDDMKPDEFEGGYSKDDNINFVIKDLESIINTFLSNPNQVLLQISGQKITDWKKRRYQFAKILSDELLSERSIRNHLKPILDKLKKQGMLLNQKNNQGNNYNQKNNQLNQKGGGSIPLSQKLVSKVKFKKKLYDNLNLYDDLVYLFPSTFNEQIASDEEGLIYGGYLITGNNPTAIQRRNFINYLRTLLIPNRPTYYFLDKCLVFPNADNERKQIIFDIKTIYSNIDKQISSLNNYENCANPQEVQRYYQLMIRRMDKYFNNISGYNEKLNRQEFHYFSTGRLKWLIEELNKYLEFIKGRCISNERIKISSQIRLLIQETYTNKCFPNLQSPEIKNKFKHIKNYLDKISQNNFDEFKISEMKFLRDELIKSKQKC